MMYDRTDTTLGDVVEFLNGGAWSADAYAESGIPVVRVSDIESETVIFADNRKFLPSHLLKRYRKNLLQEGDVVVATVGSHPTQPASVVGRAARIPRHAHGNLLNQNAVCIRPIDERLALEYLRYVVVTKTFKLYVAAHARGSANQVRMAISSLAAMPLELPTPSVQRRVSDILSAYDDLIENNTRRIKILEDMAQMLYREWFVNFRFPGHEKVRMVESELGPIPEGWTPTRLGDLCSEKRRGVHPSEVEPDMPYIGLEHLPRKSIALGEWGRAGDVGSTKLRFKRDEILFGKIRPYFHKVGVAPVDGVASSDAIVIVPLEAAYFSAVLCCVSSKDFVLHATQTSQGTKMPRANWDVLTKYPLPSPDAILLERFNETIRAIVETLQNLVFRNRNLRTTRDLLLPKLISGEISVEAADEAAADLMEQSA